ncbi:MAG: hypothetical protein J0M07_12735 [Anaerolineae bacterium]|nr:hypothetical protein [Anaerolineae bacterium]
MEVKKKLTIAINNFLEPIRERRAQYQSQPGLVEDVLVAGTERARAEAQKTMAAVREAMGMYRLPVKTL